MLVKSAKDLTLHWATEPLVFVAGGVTEVPDSLVPMVLDLGGFAVVVEAAEPNDEPDPAPEAVKPRAKRAKEA